MPAALLLDKFSYFLSFQQITFKNSRQKRPGEIIYACISLIELFHTFILQEFMFYVIG